MSPGRIHPRLTLHGDRTGFVTAVVLLDSSWDSVTQTLPSWTPPGTAVTLPLPSLPTRVEGAGQDSLSQSLSLQYGETQGQGNMDTGASRGAARSAPAACR